MKTRLLNIAACVLATVALVVFSLALRMAFRELGRTMAGPEKRSAPPEVAKTATAPILPPSSPAQNLSSETPQPVKPNAPPAPHPSVVEKEMPKSALAAEPSGHEAATEITLPYPAPPAPEVWRPMPAAERLANVRKRLMPALPGELAARQCKLGQAAFIRIFKESRELELWLLGDAGKWVLFRTYPIACFSGTLGPKTREGDMQAPEGFYHVTAKQMNPASNYHLAFNIGYPNAYDVAQKRTGSLIMVHGDMCSIGCFAMTDAVIEEIYLVVEAACKNGGSVPVHCFPFRMSPERMKEADEAHVGFWRGLLPAYEVFEKERRVPEVKVVNGKYVVR